MPFFATMDNVLKKIGVFCVLQFVFVIIYMGLKDSLFLCSTVQ